MPLRLANVTATITAKTGTEFELHARVLSVDWPQFAGVDLDDWELMLHDIGEIIDGEEVMRGLAAPAIDGKPDSDGWRTRRTKWTALFGVPWRIEDGN